MDSKQKLTSAALSGLFAGFVGLAGCTTASPEAEKDMSKEAVESSATPAAAAAPAPAAEAKGECHNINSCKGKGACGGAGHGCAGKNGCKGKGWVSMSEKECKAKKGGKFKAQ